MNVDTILKPEELRFAVSPQLAHDINALIDALERGDRDIDCYRDEVEGSARELSEEHDAWVRAYYVNFGWMKG